MLATPWPTPTRDEGWAHELKWDGVRALWYFDGDTVTIRSRRGNDVTATYPELVAPGDLDRPVVVDGEIVALDDRGLPSFERLQARINLTGSVRVATAVAENPVTFVAFDVLYDGVEVIAEPWEARRARLEGIPLPEQMPVSQVVDDVDALWGFVLDHGLEGIMSKRGGSPYRPGARSPDWRKTAAVREERAVVGGFTLGEGGRAATFGALLLGLWDGEALRWIGAVGSGLTEAQARAIRATLDQLRRASSPFHPDPGLPRDATWVEPRLVAKVRFKEWTSAGRLRAPVFLGFTADPPEEVTWEAEGPGAT